MVLPTGGDPNYNPPPPPPPNPLGSFDSEKIRKGIETAISNAGSPFERTLQEFYSPAFALVGAIEKSIVFTRRATIDSKKLTEALDNIAKGQGFETFEELKEAVKDDPEKQKIVDEARRAEIEKLDTKNRKALGKVVAISISNAVNFMATTIDAALQAQNKFLQLNLTLNQAFAKFEKRIEGLPGSMQTRLGTLFEFQKEGLKDVGKSTLYLANRMDATGQNIGALIQVQKTLVIQGRMSAVAVEAFSADLTRLSLNYNVSTEKLLEGFGELRQSLSVLSIGGTLGVVGGAVTELGAQFPVLAKTIGSFTDQLITADVGQLGILGGMQGVGKLTSSLSTDGATLRDVIRQIADGARRFTTGFRNAGLVSQRAIKNIIGDLGVMAIQLDDAFGVAAQKLGAIDQITNDFKIAFATALEPLQEGLAKSVIALGTFAANLAKLLPGSGDMTGEKIGIGITATVLGKMFWRPLVGLLTPLLGLIPAIGPMLAPVIAPLAAVAALVTGAFFLFKHIAGTTEDTAKSAAATADHTKTLVDIEKKKDLEKFGTSRFERLATKALEDNIFRVAMSEAAATRAIVQGFESNAELLKELVDAGLITPLPAVR